MKLFLLLPFLLSFVSYSQNESSKVFKTREYYPLINTDFNQLVQTFSVIQDDSTFLYKIKYEKEIRKKDTFIVTTTYSTTGEINMTIKEKITRKGMRFHSGTAYKFNEKKNRFEDFEIKGRKSISFPFKTLEKNEQTTFKYTNHYDHKLKFKSNCRFVFVDTTRLNYSYDSSPTLVFIRDVHFKQSKNFFKKKTRYSYTSYLIPNQGICYYSKKPLYSSRRKNAILYQDSLDQLLKGTLEKSEFK